MTLNYHRVFAEVGHRGAKRLFEEAVRHLLLAAVLRRNNLVEVYLNALEYTLC